MEFIRGAGFDRLLSGTKNNMKASREAGLLTEAEAAELYERVEKNYAPLEDRGLQAGDELHYRVAGDTVHTVYLGEDQAVLIDVVNVGSAHVRSLKGSYYSKESNFGDGLIGSLFAKK